MASLRVHRANNIQVHCWNKEGVEAYTISVSWPGFECLRTDTVLLAVQYPKSHRSFYVFINVQNYVSHYMVPFHPSVSSDLSNCVIHAYGLGTIMNESYRVFSGCTATVSVSKGNTYNTRPVRIPLLLNSEFKFSSNVHHSIIQKKIDGVDVKLTPPSWYTVTGISTGRRQKRAFIIFLQNKRDKGVTVFTFNGHGGHFNIPYQLQAATDHEVTVLAGIQTSNNSVLVDSSQVCSFMSYMTQRELQELFNKATKFIDSSTRRTAIIKCFYRNKSPTYFHQIMCAKGGLMEKYIKNFGGDQASSLNRNIDGLFFSTQVDPVHYTLPQFSFYGQQRIHIPVFLMMHEGTNLYFADFYCHYRNHHVTLVLTLKNSESDVFCRQRLLQLNPRFNPFLIKPPFSQICVITANVTVEVFYTEDVDIGRMMDICPRGVYFTFTETVGKPKMKTIIGVSKNKACDICNIDLNIRTKRN